MTGKKTGGSAFPSHIEKSLITARIIAREYASFIYSLETSAFDLDSVTMSHDKTTNTSMVKIMDNGNTYSFSFWSGALLWSLNLFSREILLPAIKGWDMISEDRKFQIALGIK